jgi:hypothetical protein
VYQKNVRSSFLSSDDTTVLAASALLGPAMLVSLLVTEREHPQKTVLSAETSKQLTHVADGLKPALMRTSREIHFVSRCFGRVLLLHVTVYPLGD